MEILLYIYMGAGLMFACVLHLFADQSRSFAYKVCWFIAIITLWPLFVYALARSGL